MVGVEGGLVVEEEEGEMAGGIVMFWVADGVECGVVEPPKGTAAVSEGE